MTDDRADVSHDPVSMLGRRVADDEYGRLEFFEVDAPVRVTFVTDELEALCPAVDGIQPDIYRAEISYTALTHAVESKSLKLWLVTFRDRRIFAEHLVSELHDVLASHAPAVADVSVRLTQNARGGIVTVVEHPPPDPRS
jgi:7-cyano-7-deazaguanine reductase